MNATVKDVMSTHVFAVLEDATFKEIAARLREQRVSAFRGMTHHRELAKAAALTAADLMTKPAVTIGQDEPVTPAARLMYSRRVKRLPVTSEDGKLIGIVSRSDVLSVYSRPDKDIEGEIIQDLILDTFLGNPASFTVTVQDGIVTIEGDQETTAVGRDIVEAARHAEGVVAVRDRLTYPPAADYTPNPLS